MRSNCIRSMGVVVECGGGGLKICKFVSSFCGCFQEGWVEITETG